MNDVIQRIGWSRAAGHDPARLVDREWLLTSGLGGYAFGSLSGACTRRYHGLLVAALPAPFGRSVMLNQVLEELLLGDGPVIRLDAEEPQPGKLHMPIADVLAEFRLEMGLPVWRYKTAAVAIERRIVMPYLQNTTLITYRAIAARRPLELRIEPWFHLRSHESSLGGLDGPYHTEVLSGDRLQVAAPPLPPVRLALHAREKVLKLEGGQFRDVYYRVEASRGYDSQGRLWSPGCFRVTLQKGEEATLLASTENWESLLTLKPRQVAEAELQRRLRLIAQAHPAAQRGMAAELVLAADPFLIRPASRVPGGDPGSAARESARTVIAGYPWFTDWGRDTMISLEGLTLPTGRHAEAAGILRTFARDVREGLIPNLFPEGQTDGVYHTADATLWFFHAIDRYRQATGDRQLVRDLLPMLRGIVEHHLRGTRYGIGVDPADGLLRQGAPGYQLTWMDAKVGDWVVTPRRGKAVEINALWYNALCVLQRWLRDEDDPAGADALVRQAELARQSFNRRFWYAEGGYLYDVVDGEEGDDRSFRPNQIFAISLPHAILDETHWKPVLDRVRDRLLTPFGLRSLAPGEPDYKPRYEGDLRTRDAAYHQGTVWGWLIGPFIDAWLRVYPDRLADARSFLEAYQAHLSDACIGSISEVFDADAPHRPQGCVAQAWSVAEVLRALMRIDEAHLA